MSERLRRLAARLRLPTSELARTLARGSGAALAIQGSGQLVRYALQAFFGRALGPSAFGSYSVALGSAQVLAMFASLGLATATLRFVPEYSLLGRWDRVKGFIRGSCGATLAAGTALAAVGSVGVLLFAPAALDRSVLLLGLWLVPLLGMTNLLMQIVRSAQRIALAFAPALLVGPALVWLAALGCNATVGLSGVAAVALEAAGALVVLALQLATLRRSMPLVAASVSASSDWPLWWPVARQLLVVQGALMLLNRADVLIVGLMLGPREAGIYAAAAATARLVGFSLVAAGFIAAPLIASLHARGDRQGLQRLIGLVSAATLLLSLPVAFVFAAWGRPILTLFGAEFSAGYASLVVLSVGQLVNANASHVAALLNLTGHERLSARVIGAASLLQLLLAWWLVPLVGALGAALATAIATIAWNTGLACLVRQRLGLDTFVFLFARRSGRQTP